MSEYVSEDVWTMMHPNPDEYRDELEAASKLFDSGQYGLAFAKYLPLAEGGSIGAQLRVGWMYHSGRGGSSPGLAG